MRKDEDRVSLTFCLGTWRHEDGDEGIVASRPFLSKMALKRPSATLNLNTEHSEFHTQDYEGRERYSIERSALVAQEKLV